MIIALAMWPLAAGVLGGWPAIVAIMDMVGCVTG